MLQYMQKALHHQVDGSEALFGLANVVCSVPPPEATDGEFWAVSGRGARLNVGGEVLSTRTKPRI